MSDSEALPWLAELLEQRDADGRSRFDDLEIADFLVAVLLTTGYDPASLPPRAHRLLVEFAERAQVVVGASGEETEATINAYFEAHPLRPELLKTFRRRLSDEVLAHQATPVATAFDRYLGDAGKRLLAAKDAEPPQGAVRGGPLAFHLAHSKLDD